MSATPNPHIPHDRGLCGAVGKCKDISISLNRQIFNLISKIFNSNYTDRKLAGEN